MNIQKLVTIVAAIAINCAALAWFNAVGAQAVASATPTGADKAAVTLPTITVRPTRAQLDALRRELSRPRTSSVAPSGGAGVQALVMPYHSFTDESTAADAG